MAGSIVFKHLLLEPKKFTAAIFQFTIEKSNEVNGLKAGVLNQQGKRINRAQFVMRVIFSVS